MKYLFTLLLVPILISCGQKADDTPKTEIDLKGAIESSQREKIEQYCDQLSYVKLETRDSVLLRYPFFTFTDHSIIAYEGYSIYQFSYEGKFLKSYRRHGQGPKDISAINRVLWNKDRKEIYVTDGVQSKIMTFDEDLNFITEREFRIPGYQYVTKDNYIYCGLAKDNYRNKDSDLILIRYDVLTEKKEILQRSKMTQHEANDFPIFSFGTNLYQHDSIFYYKEHRSDSIFYFTENNPIGKFAYHINIGEIYPEEIDYRHENRRDILNYIDIGGCLDLGNYLLINYSYQEYKLSNAIFNKRTGKTTCLESPEFNTLDYGAPIAIYKEAKERMYYASWINAESLLDPDFISRVKRHNSYNSQLLDIISKTTEDDNPILMFVTLKKQ